MSDWAIQARDLGKSYKISHHHSHHSYKTLRDEITRFFTMNGRRKKVQEEVFWALRGLTLDIRQGERVGIIGQNGMGKSTLLKLLARITDPTEGGAEITGRVGALLEVGTGFHPELTGRENVFLSGAILGMKRDEIKDRFEEIVAFAGIEPFIDTPVKRYSSGMFLRLAFSVMAHLQTEILIVDEVLAVGDTAFQKKCIGKMEGIAEQGKTVLFVSHQLEAIAQLCPRSILLKQGQIVMDGPTDEVIDRYYASLRESPDSLRHRTDRQGRGRFRFTDASIENEKGSKVDILHSGADYQFVLDYEVQSDHDLEEMVISVGIGTAVYGHIANFGLEEFNQTLRFRKNSQGKLICRIPKMPLNGGAFYYNISARRRGLLGEVEDCISRAGIFHVEPGQFFESVVPKNVLLLIDHHWSHKERCGSCEG